MSGQVAYTLPAQGSRFYRAVAEALNAACKAQKDGKTTVVEVMCTQELGDPFRRDALKLPHRLLEKYKHTNVG